MALKESDIPTLLEYLGADPTKINSVDDFKTLHDTDFIKKSNIESDKAIVNQIFGKRMGSIHTGLTATLKSYGIELSPEEIKDKKVEQVIELGLNKFSELSTKALEEAKAASGAKPNEQVEEWKKKYGEVEKKWKDTDELRKSVIAEKEQIVNEFNGKLKSIKIDTLKSQPLLKLKYKEKISDIEKEGFNSIINKKYKLDLDGDSLIVTDDKGERIKSTKKSGEFKTWDEVLEEEAVNAGILSLGNNKPNPARPSQGQGQPNQFAAPVTEQKTYIHPNAAKASG